MSRIGIPRSLAYYLYFPFWKTFFENIGHEVVLSPLTTKTTMDYGVKEAVNDACIPIKIYHGHVAQIKDKVDYIFSPRLVSVRKHGDFGTETFCPKFLGLPDMIKVAIEGLPEIIDTRIDLKQGKNALDEVCFEIANKIGAKGSVESAIKAAKDIHRRYMELIYKGVLVPDALNQIVTGSSNNNYNSKVQFDTQVAVVGYPYVIYDPYINVGLLKILQNENVKIYTQDMLSDKFMNKQAKYLPKSMFWYFSNRAVYGALHFMKQKHINGIIHVTAFACGPDSMVDRLLEIEARKHQKPYISIAVDEHTGEAGVRTRIEAFLDMLRYRRDSFEN